MIYVVHFPGDNPNEFGWFSGWPTRKQAMDDATYRAGIASQERAVFTSGEPAIGVKYIKHSNRLRDSPFDFSPKCWIVVQQTNTLYHGA